MAHIYKKGKKWAFRSYMGTDPITGKEIKKSKSGFLTQKDSKLASALFERQFHHGEYIKPSKIVLTSCALTGKDIIVKMQKKAV